MDGEQLQRVAAARALELPGGELTRPFGPTWDVYKVSGRVFLLVTAEPGRPVAICKAAPEDAGELCRGFAAITPGYHMNKRHWITLDGADWADAAAGPALDAQFVADLVTESYLLVLAGLPRRARPVDPEEFARAVAD